MQKRSKKDPSDKASKSEQRWFKYFWNGLTIRYLVDTLYLLLYLCFVYISTYYLVEKIFRELRKLSCEKKKLSILTLAPAAVKTTIPI